MASSLRLTATGSGTVTIAGGAAGARLVFSASQHFYPGEYIAITDLVPVERYTIRNGMGTEWQAFQAPGTTTSGHTFNRGSTLLTRNRGNVGFVPKALYYLYVASLDDNATPAHDWFTYLDPIIPISGLHPYTKDRWTGLFWDTENAGPGGTVKLVPDLATRVGNLDSLPPRLRR